MSATLKPRFDPFLWSQLRPGVTFAQASGEGASQTFSAGNVPLVPENRIATSLRVVLHDTKSMMEQFSDKLGNLLSGVDQAKRQIDKVSDSFETGQERILEELVATVNRCQKGLLEVIDTPAQAPVLDEIKLSQTETLKRLDQLEIRVDLLQNNLQTVSGQQSQIMTCLAGITPLVTPLEDISQQLHRVISLFSNMQPLLQELPAQIKLILNETSTQNFQTLQGALTVSTSMENHLESLSHIVSESTKLITAIAGLPCKPQEPDVRHHGITRAHSDAFSGVLPSCGANVSALSEQSLLKPQMDGNVERPWQNMNNPSHSSMTFESQNGQDGTNRDPTYDKSDITTSHSSVPRRTCKVSNRPRFPCLATATAPVQKESSSSITVKKNKRGRFSKAATRSVALLPNNAGVVVKRKRGRPPKAATSTAPDNTSVVVKRKKANVNSAPMVPPVKTSSTRVLRPRNPQLIAPKSNTEINTKTDEILLETNASTQSTDKILVPSHIQIPNNDPPFAPTPPPVGRRMLLPWLSDSNKDIDIELDWGDMGQI
ncbi:hypothetical protein Clacol_005710 [Clathrus columnatus]|uniref:Uncharacterized protein n=1 Tax=Clathrus columnatus TaxID=1419009 RepID=A0AAV5AA31_9AGAM|nr:hypothetical protein Clacol_005710 [Clathrus columnatus]